MRLYIHACAMIPGRGSVKDAMCQAGTALWTVLHCTRGCAGCTSALCAPSCRDGAAAASCCCCCCPCAAGLSWLGIDTAAACLLRAMPLRAAHAMASSSERNDAGRAPTTPTMCGSAAAGQARPRLWLRLGWHAGGQERPEAVHDAANLARCMAGWASTKRAPDAHGLPSQHSPARSPAPSWLVGYC